MTVTVASTTDGGTMGGTAERPAAIASAPATGKLDQGILDTIPPPNRLIRKELFRSTCLDAYAWSHWPGIATLLRWLWFVQFKDPALENKYQLYIVASGRNIRLASQMPLLFLFIALLARRTDSSVDYSTTPLMLIAYAIILLIWTAGAWMSATDAFEVLTPYIAATFDTGMGVIVLAVTGICTPGVSFTSHCFEMQHAGFSSMHFMLLLLLLLIYGIGFSMQVPLLLAHMVVLYATWVLVTLWNGYAPTAAVDRVVITVFFWVLLLMMMSKVYDRHVSLRLQFYTAAELSRQLQVNRQAMHETQRANEGAIAAKSESIRAITARDVHAALNDYTCHQVRNPLHSFQGLLHDLRPRFKLAHPVNRADTDAIRWMQSTLTQLADFSDDVQDFQRLRRGAVIPEVELVQTRLLIDRVVQNVLFGTRRPVELDIADNVPTLIHSDSSRVAQMFGTGLHNALKYSREYSSLKVRSYAQSLCANGRTVAGVKFEVWHKQYGPMVSNAEEVFDPYRCNDIESIGSMESSGRRTHFHGLGLGLPISRLVAELLCGRVGLEERNGFSVYWFCIPQCCLSVCSAFPCSQCSS